MHALESAKYVTIHEKYEVPWCFLIHPPRTKRSVTTAARLRWQICDANRGHSAALTSSQFGYGYAGGLYCWMGTTSVRRVWATKLYWYPKVIIIS
jgi:hypothetical protein